MQWATVGDMLALPSLSRNSCWDTMIGRSSAWHRIAPKLALKKKKKKKYRNFCKKQNKTKNSIKEKKCFPAQMGLFLGFL